MGNSEAALMLKSAHIYVIANGRGSHKIGTSVRPLQRLKQLQTASSDRLTLVRSTSQPTPQYDRVEAYAHWLLREAQEDGEWFSVTAEAAWVAIVAATEAVARGERAPRRIAGPGRTKQWHENINLTLPKGAKARMDAVLKADEDRLDLIRTAIDKEVASRERAATKAKPAKPDPTP